jgi:hypothetical protein
MPVIDKDFFFKAVNVQLFGGQLKPSQRLGLSAIIEAWEADHAGGDERWLAYMLATVHHETDRSFRPIREYGGPAYFTRRYDVLGENPERARRHGNTEPGDGPRYCGRGFVQLTWKDNYHKLGEVVGIDLVAAPDRALELPVATRILFHGMIAGSFTGKRLGDYFDGPVADWVDARRIINGLDKADLIAGYAKAYLGALTRVPA